MALTYSTMLELGTRAPYFSLPDVVTGRTITLNQFADRKALLVIFICRHCPYVRHIQKALAQLGMDYAGQDIGIVAISSNDDEIYPDDSLGRLKQLAKQECFTFPVCYDISQKVAKAFAAACTPDIFLFNDLRKLVYRGQFDGSRPGNDVPVTGCDLRAAIEAVLGDVPVFQNQKPSMGCSIKWKPGNEPEYITKPGELSPAQK